MRHGQVFTKTTHVAHFVAVNGMDNGSRTDFVMVSHDLRKGFDMCTHALVLARGRVVTFGAKDQLDFDEFSELYRSTVGMGVS